MSHVGRFTAVILTLAALAGLCGCTSQAITLRVVDVAGDTLIPLRNLNVQVEHDGEIVSDTPTDAAGRVRWSGPSGTYTIVARGGGYEYSRRTLELKAGSTTVVNLKTTTVLTLELTRDGVPYREDCEAVLLERDQDRVLLRRNKTPCPDEDDTCGSLVFPQAPEGEYRVLVMGTGVAATIEVEVQPGRDNVFPVGLSADGYKIVHEKTDADGHTIFYGAGRT